MATAHATSPARTETQSFSPSQRIKAATTVFIVLTLVNIVTAITFTLMGQTISFAAVALTLATSVVFF